MLLLCVMHMISYCIGCNFDVDAFIFRLPLILERAEEKEKKLSVPSLKY